MEELQNVKKTTKDEFEKFCCENWNAINDYIDLQMQDLPTPLYTSIDIRESKDKFAPVDNNIYPAGFNNLCLLDLDETGRKFKQTFEQCSSSIKKIAILPESHTKNLFYLDNLAVLKKCLDDAGFDVTILSFDNNLFVNDETLSLVSQSKYDLQIKKGFIENGKIGFHQDGEKNLIDFLIMNNDQSEPLPLNWAEIETPVRPSPQIGWFKRQKSQHFCFYHQVVNHFCEKFNIASNLLEAKFKAVNDLDFSTKDGLDSLGSSVDALLKELPSGSKVFVKASQGTYGMGISVVSSGKEIIEMNRKTRNKMDVGKNKKKFTSALVQEAVETIVKYDDMPAEVTIYLVQGKTVGGFQRANPLRGTEANLNSRGMVYKKFCISEIREANDFQAKEATYSIIARLSTMASAMEIKELRGNHEGC